MAKLDNLEDDVRALEKQLNDKKKELQEEQQRIKNARHAKLEDLATNLVSIIKEQGLTTSPDTWDETDGDWVHEHLLETGFNFGGELNAQGIYITGMYERKGIDTTCMVNADSAEKIVLTVVLDAYDPAVKDALREFTD